MLNIYKSYELKTEIVASSTFRQNGRYLKKKSLSIENVNPSFLQVTNNCSAY